MAARLLEKYQQDIEVFELHPSHGGVFEVTVGDELVFSKKALKRFPEEGEIEDVVDRKIMK